MNFKEGDMVKITSRKHGHSFKIGEAVKIVKLFKDHYKATGEFTGSSFITDEEARLVVPPSAFNIGDVVYLNLDEGQTPMHGFAGVKNLDVGLVVDVRSKTVRVKFPSAVCWTALPEELAHGLPPYAKGVLEKLQQIAGASAVVAPKKSKVRKAYMVVNKAEPNLPLAMCKSRSMARKAKAALGGKEAGYILWEYVRTKEIR